MRELQRAKRLDLEKELKDLVERIKLENSKDLEEATKRGNETKRELERWRLESERRMFEMGEDSEALRVKVEGAVSDIQSEVAFETRRLRDAFQEFETGNKLKWEQLLGNYKDQVENFQSRRAPNARNHRELDAEGAE